MIPATNAESVFVQCYPTYQDVLAVSESFDTLAPTASINIVDVTTDFIVSMYHCKKL